MGFWGYVIIIFAGIILTTIAIYIVNLNEEYEAWKWAMFKSYGIAWEKDFHLKKTIGEKLSRDQVFSTWAEDNIDNAEI